MFFVDTVANSFRPSAIVTILIYAHACLSEKRVWKISVTKSSRGISIVFKYTIYEKESMI